MDNQEAPQEEFVFDPEFELQPEELSALASVYGQPGFKVITKILRKSVDWFIKQLINADPAIPNEVLSRQNQAKTAAQFYTLWLDNINELVMQYIHAHNTGKTVEAAPGLDFDDTENITEEEM